MSSHALIGNDYETLRSTHWAIARAYAMLIDREAFDDLTAALAEADDILVDLLNENEPRLQSAAC